MIVLDASVLIAHLDGGDAHHDRAVKLLSESAAEALGASTISLAETLVAPARAGRLSDANTALRRLGIVELSLGADAASRLAELRAGTGCKLPDCCVLLAAREGEGVVASFDSALLTAAADMNLATIS